MNRPAPPFELFVDRHSMAVAHAFRPKVIIPALDAAAAAALDLRGPFDTLLFDAPRLGSSAALRAPSSPPGSEDSTPLETVPNGACLSLVLTEPGRAQLQPLDAWWKAMSPGRPLDRLEVDGSGPAARELVFRRLLEVSEREASALAHRVTELYAQLGALRDGYETLDREGRALHARLERVHALDRHLASMALPCSPGRSVGRESGAIVQPLPVSSEGLARIDLHLSGGIAPADVSDGSLGIVLRSAEDGLVLGRWRARGGELLPGWFRCELPRAGLVSRHHLELAITWDPAPAGDLRLSLAEADPFQDFLARGPSGERLSGLLAMVLWTGLPGGAPEANGSVLSSEERPALAVEPWIEFELSASDFARVVPTHKAPEHCRSLEDGRGLLLHPVVGSLAEARIPLACPPATDRVVASVRVANPSAASPVEFAMLVSEAGRHRRLPSNPNGTKNVLGFSGWVTASTAGTPCLLGVQLAAPTRGWADLLLATRIAPGASNAYCWAEWNTLRVRLSRSERG